ncbi:MAG: DEAD/DEAH box helicase [Halanaerobiaceae bacterium]|nr:DEAD/DEAH box helicase [Halanaerobiaceae bacterium]
MENIKELMSENVIIDIKNKIEEAGGQEIFLLGYIDKKTKKVTDIDLLARGNSNMVPAIISDLKPGMMIIHNHPSGDLSPSAADIRVASRTGNNGIGFAIINNEVTDIYVVVVPKIPDEEIKIDKDEIIDIFSPGGQMEKLLRDYEYREQQLAVLEKIIDSLNEHRYLFVEAGTGTGKSFAYLLPALYWSVKNKECVVVSTNTINLQEQLMGKDLICLKKILPFSFKAVLVKGRNNYVCKRKQKLLEKRSADIYSDNPDKQEELVKILNWLENTETGSRSELSFVIKTDIWEELASESDLCLKTKCPYFNSCFFMLARKEVFSADLLIVNHHLLLSDAVLKSENADNDNGILPKYRKLIIDEAHNLVDTATAHLGEPFYIAAVNKYFQRLYHNKYSLIPALREKLARLKSADLDRFLKIIDNKIIPQILKIKEISTGYFNVFDNILENEEKVIRVDENTKAGEHWQDILEYSENMLLHLQKMGIYLQELYEEIMKLPASDIYDFDEMLIELESYILRCQLFIKALDFNIKAEDSDYVFWIEKKGENIINQENAPLDIAGLMAELLWDRLDTLVLTSATLTVNKDFSFFQKSLGLEKSDTLQVESPFNYSEQAELLIPEDILPANSPGFIESVIDDLEKILLAVAGRTMVLFTSYRMLNYCEQKLRDSLQEAGINILAQGNHSRNYIIERFKQEENQIIFGTDSFWEGVDIKGDNLQLLIIMKLPFPVPDEPVAAARMEMLKKEGKNPFFQYSIPRAVIRFKQGFGRLIRSKKDRGVIICFDNRIITKQYGKFFLNSLPEDCPVRYLSIDSLTKEGVILCLERPH